MRMTISLGKWQWTRLRGAGRADTVTFRPEDVDAAGSDWGID
jgi:hypothetical protein